MAAKWTAGMTALVVALEGADNVTNHALDDWGIVPREADRLPNIFIAPFLHFGWDHLMANALPLVGLGFLLLLEGLRRFAAVTLIVTLASGLLVWLTSAPGTMTLGASGVIFGWFTYLLVRGLYTKSMTQILLSIGLFLLWGGMLWGVLPIMPGVSWQGHLGGAIGGVLAAKWLLTPRKPEGHFSY